MCNVSLDKAFPVLWCNMCNVCIGQNIPSGVVICVMYCWTMRFHSCGIAYVMHCWTNRFQSCDLDWVRCWKMALIQHSASSQNFHLVGNRIWSSAQSRSHQSRNLPLVLKKGFNFHQCMTLTFNLFSYIKNAHNGVRNSIVLVTTYPITYTL